MAQETDLNNKDIDICVVSEPILCQKCRTLLLTYPSTKYLDEIGTGRAWIADVKVESLYLQGVTWS